MRVLWERAGLCETKACCAALRRACPLLSGHPDSVVVTTGDLSFKGVMKHSLGALPTQQFYNSKENACTGSTIKQLTASCCSRSHSP